MGLIVQSISFVGKYKIALTQFSKLDDYINKYESRRLKELLGVELYNLFAADVVNYAPQSTIYQTIFNPIEVDDKGIDLLTAIFGVQITGSPRWGRIRISDGIKEMLLGFIYFEYMRDDKFKSTPDGTTTQSNENARETNFTENNIVNRYNEAVKSYQTIQWYINKHLSDYPLFNGEYKELMADHI